MPALASRVDLHLLPLLVWRSVKQHWGGRCRGLTVTEPDRRHPPFMGLLICRKLQRDSQAGQAGAPCNTLVTQRQQAAFSLTDRPAALTLSLTMKLTPATNRCSPVAGGGGRLRGEYRRGGGTGDLQTALNQSCKQVQPSCRASSWLQREQLVAGPASCRAPRQAQWGWVQSRPPVQCVCRLSYMVCAQLAWLLWIWRVAGRLSILAQARQLAAEATTAC